MPQWHQIRLISVHLFLLAVTTRTLLGAKGIATRSILACCNPQVPSSPVLETHPPVCIQLTSPARPGLATEVMPCILDVSRDWAESGVCGDGRKYSQEGPQAPYHGAWHCIISTERFFEVSARAHVVTDGSKSFLFW